MLMILSVWFRKVAVGVMIFGVVVGAFVYFLNEREDERSLARIQLSELEFENVTLTPGYSRYKLSGRIKNNSPEFSVKRVDLLVTVQDCTDEPDAGEPDVRECVTIGESYEEVDLDIPPGQARDFEKSLYFPGGGLKLLGEVEWNYTVSQIRGE